MPQLRFFLEKFALTDTAFMHLEHVGFRDSPLAVAWLHWLCRLLIRKNIFCKGKNVGFSAAGCCRNSLFFAILAVSVHDMEELAVDTVETV